MTESGRSACRAQQRRPLLWETLPERPRLEGIRRVAAVDGVQYVVDGDVHNRTSASLHGRSLARGKGGAGRYKIPASHLVGANREKSEYDESGYALWFVAESRVRFLHVEQFEQSARWFQEAAGDILLSGYITENARFVDSYEQAGASLLTRPRDFASFYGRR